ncbi:exonuclease domain-containing protein [Streptacidiphilus cavernicola]|uniref:Exonuclease domain-containing protein n=1 Tax=Streptacidiphilus cavernicola TaxID=3342716 RepID=A0ABV6W490_9ACTN
MTWTTRRAAWDTETTGIDADEDHIVTAALVVTGGGQPDLTLTWLINSGKPSHPKAIETHGITDEQQVAEGQDPKVALDDLATKLGEALDWGMSVAGFNVPFDWTILDRDLARNGLPSMAERLSRPLTGLVDGLLLDRTLDKYRPGSRKLEAVAAHYGVVLKNAHTADADARAALGVVDRIFGLYPQAGATSSADLFAAQVGWYAIWAEGFEAHRRKSEPDFSIAREWPLTPAGSAP